jgi:hypothetical protein
VGASKSVITFVGRCQGLSQLRPGWRSTTERVKRKQWIEGKQEAALSILIFLKMDQFVEREVIKNYGHVVCVQC